MAAKTDLDDLIARCALGDRQAFLALYRASSAKLFGVSLRILKDRGEAEEVLQESFVKVWYAAERYRPGVARPMTWLITVVRNTAIDRYRQLKAERARTPGAAESEAAIDTTPDPGRGPEASAIAAAERGQLADCLGELPEERSEAIQRAYMLGDTYAELADRFGVPLNTMRTWLRRGLLKLKDCLTR